MVKYYEYMQRKIYRTRMMFVKKRKIRYMTFLLDEMVIAINL